MGERDRSVPDAQRVQWRRRVAMLLWRALAVVGMALALVGTVLPVMPTVPFLLLAAWGASQGWPAFDRWLLRHPSFGPPIARWRANRAVPRKAKWVSTLMMAASGTAMQFFDSVPLYMRIATPLIMLAVAVWMWQRPDA